MDVPGQGTGPIYSTAILCSGGLASTDTSWQQYLPSLVEFLLLLIRNDVLVPANANV